MRFIFIPFPLFFLLSMGDLEEEVSTDWASAFSLNGEHKIAKSSLLTTLPRLTKEWRVTFDVKPGKYHRGWASVIHMTIGGKGGEEGDRIPGVWFHKARGILISTALNGNPSYHHFSKPLPSVGEWIQMEISQSLLFSTRYVYMINIANKNVLTKTNTKPMEFTDVKVFAGSQWYPGQKGSIKNLKIEIMAPISHPPPYG